MNIVFSVGETVRILQPLFLGGKLQSNIKGVVIAIYGEYHYVRPNRYKKVMVELYRTELEKIQ